MESKTLSALGVVCAHAGGDLVERLREAEQQENRMATISADTLLFVAEGLQRWAAGQFDRMGIDKETLRYCFEDGVLLGGEESTFAIEQLHGEVHPKIPDAIWLLQMQGFDVLLLHPETESLYIKRRLTARDLAVIPWLDVAVHFKLRPAST